MESKWIGPVFLRGIEFIEKASLKTKPFFLYYVPLQIIFKEIQMVIMQCLNQSIINLQGASRYTDGTKGGDREDMVIENDLAFGSLLKKFEKRMIHEILKENNR